MASETKYVVGHERQEEFATEADAVGRAEELRKGGVDATVAMVVTTGGNKTITQV